MRCPSSPGQGGASSPGISFWNLRQNTVRPLVLPAGGFGSVGPPHTLMSCMLAGFEVGKAYLMCSVFRVVNPSGPHSDDDVPLKKPEDCWSFAYTPTFPRVAGAWHTV